MNASTSEVYTVEHQRPRGTSPATILTGLTLLVIGVVWLLDATGLLSVSWYAVLAITLVMVGLGMVVGSFSGEYGGLIGLGIVLTVVLTAVAWADISLEGGFGDREITPLSYETLEPEYNQVAGTLTLDLTRIDWPATDTTVQARVNAGELIVYVPRDMEVEIDWRITAGEAKVFGTERSGIFIEGSNAVRSGDGTRGSLKLDLVVTTGMIEVRQ